MHDTIGISFLIPELSVVSAINIKLFCDAMILSDQMSTDGTSVTSVGQSETRVLWTLGHWSVTFGHLAAQQIQIMIKMT